MLSPLTLLGLSLLLVPTALSAQLQIHPDELKLKPEIDSAIAKGVESLLDRQLRDGSWGVDANYIGGRAGLCAYALLKSGMQMEHPALQRAFGHLDNVNPNKTYSTTCMMLAYGVTGDPQHRGKLQKMLGQLLKWQRHDGSWGYPGGNPDLSNTQYAALGLWVASKAGLKVPAKAWNELIEAVFKFQEEPRLVDAKISKRTGVAKLEVAGFAYRPIPRRNPKDKKPPPGHQRVTGSMTTAGVSVLKICEIGLGKRLRAKARQRVNHAIESGLNWLHANFSVSKNPGKGGSRLLYYLYGMERVGSLTRRELFGDRRWYIEGTRYLIKKQKNGAWGSEVDTAFALLFMRRATQIGRPTTGGSSAVTARHLFEAGSSEDDIALRGAGQQPIAIYINGFGKRLLEEHGKHGLRILRVDYLEGKRKFGELAADPTKAWTTDTFLHRGTLSRGPHIIEARVIAVAPDLPPGDTSKTVTIKSKPMQVTIRDVLEPWMESIGKMQRGNLLRNIGVRVTPSSNPKQAKNVVDGKDTTVWWAEANDLLPSLTLTFPRTIKARRLILTQALLRDADLNKASVIQEIDLAWNKGKRSVRIKLHEDPLAPTEFVFPKLQIMRQLTLKIVRRKGKMTLPVGFAEIVLTEKHGKK